jgi:peptidoglycan/LPS O-acetylase OafA/YrhL
VPMSDASTANARATDDTVSTEGFAYQPALDGLRALAVSVVVAFHYPPETAHAFRGGFLGVDAFFVLSGFLITTLLLEEHRRTGSVSLRKFYARRALRLLPAASVLLVVGVALSLFLSDTAPARPKAIGLFGMAAYIANWVQIFEPGSLGELSHTWSLAIEEQFYLLWPLALVLLLRRGARARTMLVVIGAGIAASAAWRAVVWTHAAVPHSNFIDYYLRITSGAESSNTQILLHRIHVWDRWYFGTDTRADALLAGCFVAVALVMIRERTPDVATRVLRFAPVIGLLGVAIIVWRAEVFTSGWVPNWGVLVFEVCIALVIAGLVTAPYSVIAHALALSPLVWIGRRSYAIYLFHPIVFRFLNTQVYDISWSTAFVLSIGAVIVIAEVSYRLIEAPALRGKRRFAVGPVAR